MDSLREPLGGKQVLLGVSGSIAAYKACDLARQLVAEGARVRVAPTRAATRFVTPLTFEALTKAPCLTDVLAMEDGRIPHVEEAYDADLVVVAPATANVIAKMAHGMADEALLATLLSVRAPVVVAPAMETRMWRHPATQENVELLRSRGAILVDPDDGKLASGREGEGRLASLERILEAARRALTEPDLERRHIVITAGPTAEDIDPVRYLTNRSSGRMGFALATAASRRGALVTLVHGRTSAPLPTGQGIELVSVRSAQDMHDAVMATLDERRVDAAILSAAVADFRPRAAKTEKIKKESGGLEVAFERTPDILAALGKREDRPVLVGFAAETSNLAENAQRKLEEKRCDLICANDVSAPGLGFDSEENHLVVYRKGGEPLDLGRGSKLTLAHGVLDSVVELLRGRA